jgi:hypothetical protein
MGHIESEAGGEWEKFRLPLVKELGLLFPDGEVDCVNHVLFARGVVLICEFVEGLLRECPDF